MLEARKTAKSKGELSKEERNAELGKALKGVMGMMRFGHYDSPVLLEALGDLLLSEGIRSNDAKRLATRAYIKAARETEDESVKADYMSLASHSLSMQTVSASDSSQMKIGALDAELTRDLAEADAWFQTVRADELMWIKANKDVDQEFSRKYYQDPQMSSSVSPWPNILIWAAFGGPALGVSLVLLVLWARRKRGAGPQTVPA